MPTVFLSYSRKDERRATQLAEALRTRGVEVWRDQQDLRPGENWPSALGDAIAAADALVLVWSIRAAESQEVKKEWSTALAHGKRVIPCLLDSTPLPSSLRTFHAVNASALTDAASRVANALGLATNPVEKSPGDRRIIWAAALCVILLILAATAWWKQTPNLQTLAGTINDEVTRQPLPNVQVSVLRDGRIIASGSTDAIGHYRLQIAAPADTEVTLVSKKDHYLIDQRYARLGNTEFDFNLGKEHK